MHICSIEIENYKTFKERTKIGFEATTNVIVGRNNSGKSSLLEALSLNIEPNPHRSLASVVRKGLPPEGMTHILVKVALNWEDLCTLLAQSQQNSLPLCLPLLNPESELAHSIGYDGQPETDPFFLNWLQSHSLVLTLVYMGGWSAPTGMSFTISFANYPTVRQESRQYFQLVPAQEPTLQRATTNVDMNLGQPWAERLRKHIHIFRSSRLTNILPSYGMEHELAPDGSNLTAVLDLLQRDRAGFATFNELVSQVLPEIKHVSVKSINTGIGSIEIWMHDPSTRRDDLTVPLTHAGSGVSHVLAMMYILLAEDRRIILIDEPQSFLHPGALRKLIEIFRTYSNHQFIISTHSPTVISASGAETITLLTLENGESKAAVIKPQDVAQARAYLAEIGASLSDLFGAERVLWVEGPTEEECFGLIIRKFLAVPLLGTIIKGIISTGELESKRTRRIFDIYNRLAEGPGLLPPAIGFVLDDELRSDTVKGEIQSMGRGHVHFLGRRMYENYLLRPKAIALILSTYDELRPTGKVTEEEVSEWLHKNGMLPKYGHALLFDQNQTWLRYVDAASLLEDLFASLSENRVSFQKTIHSVELTKAILDNEPEELREIAELLRSALQFPEFQRTVGVP